jgi:hypothetical protein
MTTSLLFRATAGAHHDEMDPRYPIGTFTFDPVVTADKRRERIGMIAALPAQLEAAVKALPPGALDVPYRDGGWTARQVVHHLADSHVNSYVRVRLALTEDAPTIKTYEESRWAELHDARSGDPEVSLALLRAVHARLVSLLESLGPEDFERAARHPEWGDITVDWLLQMYSWHGRHHLGHIGIVREKLAVPSAAD